MIAINEMSWGLELQLANIITLNEITQLKHDINALPQLPENENNKGLYVDMSLFVAFNGIENSVLLELQALILAKGYNRVALIVTNPITPMYFEQIANKKRNDSSRERLFLPRKGANWKQQALDWITSGVDPLVKHQERRKKVRV